MTPLINILIARTKYENEVLGYRGVKCKATNSICTDCWISRALAGVGGSDSIVYIVCVYHVYTYCYMCIHIYMYIHISLSLYICIYIYIYIYVCMYVCVYIYIY